MLRIATTQIYQQAAKAMNERQVALNKVQQQMATGQRLLSNADDPVGSARLLSLNEEIGRYGQYQRNIDLANGRLKLEDSVLGDAGELLQQTRELVVQANNDTLNDSDRKAIGKQVRQIQEQMVGLANTKDGNGEYLFAGFKSQTQPFVMDANKQTSYHGDQGQRLIKAGPSLDVAVGDSGSAAFQVDAADPTKGVFASLDKLAAALETPSPQFHDVMANGLTELDQGLENLVGVRAQVGSRLNALEAQESANGDFAVHLQETINSIDSLDYAEAATRLSQEAFTLQAAQQSFVRIQNLSLFNYMR
ncbi:MAG TPA: flagellar hook-associated protein FlgL [Candidatus Competibacter sp.]|nr:flagellar hook-associated protein 3 [Candidatus Competibacteraceae bacterium]HRE55459.1 flagellar hook-associated protein FlgL [Candidatus Competibacter sp.]HUM96116.1 flagellar hook-associated protein FlgL [Candidatus Competibacter sp.]